jgi:hypothetical protein
MVATLRPRQQGRRVLPEPKEAPRCRLRQVHGEEVQARLPLRGDGITEGIQATTTRPATRPAGQLELAQRAVAAVVIKSPHRRDPSSLTTRRRKACLLLSTAHLGNNY